MNDDPKALARTFYQAGKAAFESGEYRQSISLLEKAIALVPKTSILSGEAGIWLVMAQDASGRNEDAIALCTQLAKHPHTETAQQGRRLLYILKAPKLTKRPEWKTEIPDLSKLEDGDRTPSALANYPRTPKKRKPRKDEPLELEPIDWSQVDTKDNQFIGIALAVISLLVVSWAVLS
ncbi:MAG: tetratricopeptide repeat protein [Merismopedia sp. SIO2A8]|nr:tetratricopeptide repeat protein [Symploca sp. SIO2B6]NET52734.1 tetratricopeptide repeat protein [Merismopedia sp. SIO2A8]